MKLQVDYEHSQHHITLHVACGHTHFNTNIQIAYLIKIRLFIDILYTTASKSTLKIIEPIHNTYLRIVIGALSQAPLKAYMIYPANFHFTFEEYSTRHVYTPLEAHEPMQTQTK